MTQHESEPQKEIEQQREELAHGVDNTDQQHEQAEKAGKEQERAGAVEDEAAGWNKLKWDRQLEIERDEGGGSGL